MPFDPAVSQAAAAALESSMNDEPVEVPAPEPVVEEEPNTQEQPEAHETPGTTSEEDSTFEGLDLSSVDPHVAQRIREGFLRRDDYTRKTQELAEQRKQIEQLGVSDLGQLQYAVQLMTALQENPHDVAQQLAQQLGLSFAQQAGAAPEMPVEEDEEWEDLPDHVKRELQASREANRRLDAFLAEQEQQRQLDQIARQYQEEVSNIRRVHKDYDDDDINAVTAFAYLANGNMGAGNVLYEKMVDRIISRYVSQKGSVAPAVTGPVTQGHAVQPVEIKTLADAAEIAREMLDARLADS